MLMRKTCIISSSVLW